MNKKGFTLIELLTAIVIIGLIMMIAFPLVTKLGAENRDTLYHSYENMMEEYAQIGSYRDEDYIVLGDIEELNQVQNECSGYVKADKDSKEYKAYISCGDQYKTEGYDENYTK